MKEFTNVAGSVTSFAGSVNFFALAGYHAQGHDLNVFLKFSETIFTPKEWILSKKGPKEGERVARGHFHERRSETPVHWLHTTGVGPTPKPFSVSENGSLELKCDIVDFMTCLISYFIHTITMALNSSDLQLCFFLTKLHQFDQNHQKISSSI